MRAKFILPGEAIALHRGKIARPDVLGKTSRCYFVLHISVHHAADRRRAEADHRFTIIGRVALKISPQLPCILSNGEIIALQGEVVEAHLTVSGQDERFADGFGLCVAPGAVGEGGFVYHPLVFHIDLPQSQCLISMR